jgi:hypothetical protein
LVGLDGEQPEIPESVKSDLSWQRYGFHLDEKKMVSGCCKPPLGEGNGTK